MGGRPCAAALDADVDAVPRWEPIERPRLLAIVYLRFETPSNGSLNSMGKSAGHEIANDRENVQFYSHPLHRQDRWVVEEVFDHKRNGFFIDAGAGPDGIKNSNTYALEVQLCASF